MRNTQEAIVVVTPANYNRPKF